MKRLFLRRLLARLSPGGITSLIFIILFGFAIGFWFYTQAVYSRVREFQKVLVDTQVSIYLNLIAPQSPEDTSIDTNLFESVVLDAPYPFIFTDMDLNPLQDYWHNVPVAIGDTTEASHRKLRDMVREMDRVNPPKEVSFPALLADTFRLYDLPPQRALPFAVTDADDAVLYTRNIAYDEHEGGDIQTVLSALDAQVDPVFYILSYDRQLVFHGVTKGDWPLILTETDGSPLFWYNIGYSLDGSDSEEHQQLRAVADYIGAEGYVTDIDTRYEVPVTTTWLYHYGDLPFLKLIALAPVIELLLILIMLSIGYIGFKNIKNAEQRSIWVGMAKETAHQLGTPISSLSGWVELLKTDHDPELTGKAIPDMEYDLQRLTRVAARFSNIGSRPELKPIDVSTVCDEVLTYYRARVPRMGRQVLLEGDYNGLRQVLGNRELLNWAFENLIKNSLASIDVREGRVKIAAGMSKDFEDIILDFSDNGRGIDPSDFKNIMKPGFTTKKRGWGLGLNLVKRIIEDYHGGKFFLLSSKPGAGTTFRMVLPVISKKELARYESKNTLG